MARAGALLRARLRLGERLAKGDRMWTSSKITAVALVALLLSVALSATASARVELFREYEKPSEVPVIGKAPPRANRSNRRPALPLVRLATHYVEISNEASNVRCHGVSGRLVSCRAHLNDWVVARLTISPIGEWRDNAIRCETLRKLDGPLTAGACWDFMWSFNQWQNPPTEELLADSPRAVRSPEPWPSPG
jgi:hypothetical protein